MGVKHKVALHGGSTQGGSTWEFKTGWLYMGVQNKVALHRVQNKVALHGGSKQGCSRGRLTKGGFTWGFNTW